MRSGCLLAFGLSVLAGCTHAEPAATDVRFVERFTMGGDTSSPLIIAIHGRGDTPESFADVLDGFPGRAEIALPQGFSRMGLGWSWFDGAAGVDNEALATSVRQAEE